MKLEKFKAGNKKKVTVISTIILIFILMLGIIIYQSYALYEDKKTFNVLNGTVPTFSSENIELAYTINGKSNIGSFPNKDDEYIVENTTCENGVLAEWDEEVWGIVNIVNPNKVKKVKCTIAFKNMCDYEPNYEWTFAYRTLAEAQTAGDSSQEYEFDIPCSGNYKVELWGAQGGNSNSFGAYTKGDINLKKDNTLYLYVGEHSTNTNGGYNGGGNGTIYELKTVASGGGATDIRLVNGSWDNPTSLNSRIMVAAGGGGNSHGGSGASGGGLKGYNGIPNPSYTGPNSYGYGGLQISGGEKGYFSYSVGEGPTSGEFGKGGNGNTDYGGGGGSGYYGGGGSGVAKNSKGGGGSGSSFISGHTGCVAITSKDDRTPRKGTNEGNCADETTDIECSKHYSGFVFTDTVMIDGNGFKWTTEKIEPAEGMPAHDGTTETMTGNSGNGFAKITYLGK